jgi:L-ascorbate metabolism protein UlaG (beta-lactamase superfamily)
MVDIWRFRITYIGGPTALLEWGRLRFLTDPTFDPIGSEFRTASYTLRKTRAPALGADELGPLDAVLLSHDQHFDNLDTAGRRLVEQSPRVLTTLPGAARLGTQAVGLAPWESVDLPAADRATLRITATPARHGPAHHDRGPVIGFALSLSAEQESSVYVSGDTVWFDDLVTIGQRFTIGAALLFMGAARIAAVGPWHLTFTAAEAVEAARAFSDSWIIPLHFEGWEHLSQSRVDVEEAFSLAGLAHRLRWPEPGVAMEIPIHARSGHR